jgi:hypothetical protein
MTHTDRQEIAELVWWIRDAANSICGQNGATPHQDKLLDAADLLECLTTPPVGDMVMVPKWPTDEMVRAANEAYHNGHHGYLGAMHAALCAALSAAAQEDN